MLNQKQIIFDRKLNIGTRIYFIVGTHMNGILLLQLRRNSFRKLNNHYFIFIVIAIIELTGGGRNKNLRRAAIRLRLLEDKMQFHNFMGS